MLSATELQPDIIKHFELLFKEKRLAHAYLFEGSKGVGKRDVSIWIAKAIFCASPSESGAPCNQCVNCVRINEGNHPDVTDLVPDGTSIKVSQVRELKESLTRSGMESSKRIIIVESSELMTSSAANGLLKFIEEPEAETFLFLLTELKNRILPTVQSRCQIVHFPSVSSVFLEKSLIGQGYDKLKIKQVIGISHSLIQAVELLNNEWFPSAYEAVDTWVKLLLDKNTKSFLFVHTQLVSIFKEKEQQAIFFDLVIQRLRRSLYSSSNQTLMTSRQIEVVLSAQVKHTANVSFQAVCEQIVLRFIKSSTT